MQLKNAVVLVTERVRHPLYETWERPVTIRPGQTEKIVIDLPAEGVRKQP